jgi:hypothetical protein
MSDDLEGRLRSALRAEADPVDPDPDRSLGRIRARTAVARRRRRAIVGVVVAAVALVPLVGAFALIDRDQHLQTAGPGTTSPQDTSTSESTATTGTTSTTPTSEPPAAADVLWPQDAADSSTDERDVAERFVRDILGFDQAIVGEPNGDTVPVVSANESGAAGASGGRLVSTIDMTAVDGNWYVVGAHSDSVVVDAPAAFAGVSTPVTVAGKGRGFEAVLVAEVRDGDGTVLGQRNAAGGCCETLESFTVDVPISAPASAVGMVVLHNTTGADFQTPDFTVVPVRFTAAFTTVSVFFGGGSGNPLVSFSRQVPKTTSVLRAAVGQELGGPTGSESATSLFSAATAAVPFDVNLSNGAAVVDFDPSLATIIPGASASAASAELIAELDATVFQFPSVTSVEYRLGGSCAAFWSWLQQACHTETRA